MFSYGKKRKQTFRWNQMEQFISKNIKEANQILKEIEQIQPDSLENVRRRVYLRQSLLEALKMLSNIEGKQP